MTLPCSACANNYSAYLTLEGKLVHVTEVGEQPCTTGFEYEDLAAKLHSAASRFTVFPLPNGKYFIHDTAGHTWPVVATYCGTEGETMAWMGERTSERMKAVATNWLTLRRRSAAAPAIDLSTLDLSTIEL